MDSRLVHFTTNCRLGRAGLTLPEVLIGLGLVGIVAVLVASVMFAHFRLFTNQSTTIDISSQNKIALAEIANQIRQSQAIATTCANNRCPQDTTGSSVVVLQLWALDAESEPQASAYDYIVLRQDPQDNTKLIRKIYPDTTSLRQTGTQVIAIQLSPTGLQFAYDNADVTQASEVTATVTTTAYSGTKTHTITQSSTVILRNK